MKEEQNNIQIPIGWNSKTLEEISSDLHQGINTAADKIAYTNSGYKILQAKHVTTGEIDWSDARTVSKENYEYYKEKYNPRKNDILLTNIGTIGKSLVVKREIDFLIAWNIFLIRLKSELSPDYINYYLKYLDGKKYFQRVATGVATMFVNKANLSKINIPTPLISTQLAIVAKIEELFSELDKGIENLRLAQQQLKTYRQAVLKWAFEGKLTRGLNHDSFDLDDEHDLNTKNHSNHVNHTNHSSDKGELPEGWRNVSITELVEKNKHALKAGPFGSSLKKEFYVEKGYKIYGQEQVISGDAFYGDYFITEEKYQELSSCKIKPFDILISLVGTVGKVLLLPENCKPGVINPRLIKISLDRNIYSPRFFKYYFESSFVKSFYGAETRGTTMDVLNLGIIKTIPFPLCSIEEQNKIVQEIESRLSVADKMEESITQSLQQTEALRQSILKKAFEGRLVV